MKPLDLIILLLTIFLSTCQDKQKEIITLLVKEWQGKQILFPENMVFTRFASDTTNFVIPTSDYKVLVFVDSIGCTSCKLQLSRWKEFIRYTDSIISFEFAVLSNFLCSYFWIWKSRIGRRSTSDFCIRFLMFNLSSGAGFLMKMFFLLIFQKIFGFKYFY